MSLMDTLGLPKNGNGAGDSDASSENSESAHGSHKGLARRLSGALESGNDSRVASILRDFVEECMDTRDAGGYEEGE